MFVYDENILVSQVKNNNIFSKRPAGGNLNIRCILVLGGAPQTPYLCLADGISCAQAVDSIVYMFGLAS